MKLKEFSLNNIMNIITIIHEIEFLKQREKLKGIEYGGVYGAVVLQDPRLRGYVVYGGGCVLYRGGP